MNCINENVSVLLGQVLTSIDQASAQLIFTLTNGDRYMLYHEQDCCENVNLEDVAGDLSDLVGSPITMAEECASEPAPEGYFEQAGYTPESYTWTFYKFATLKGYVTLRWLGESNGYYSESVDFAKLAA